MSELQGIPQLTRYFKASLRYMRQTLGKIVLKKKNNCL